jgi:hypothetical protein
MKKILGLSLAFENSANPLALYTSRVPFHFARRRACASLRRTTFSRLRAVSRGERGGRDAEVAGTWYLDAPGTVCECPP